MVTYERDENRGEKKKKVVRKYVYRPEQIANDDKELLQKAMEESPLFDGIRVRKQTTRERRCDATLDLWTKKMLQVHKWLTTKDIKNLVNKGKLVTCTFFMDEWYTPSVAFHRFYAFKEDVDRVAAYKPSELGAIMKETRRHYIELQKMLHKKWLS